MFKSALSGAVLAMALSTAQAAATELFVKDGNNLNCRVGPSTAHHVIKVLQPKQSVKLLNHHNGWAKIRAHHAVCWASKAHLTTDPHRHQAPKHVAKKHPKPAPKCHYPKPVITLNVDYAHHGAFKTGECSAYAYGKIEPKKHVQKW